MKRVVGAEQEQLDVVARGGPPVQIELIVPVDRLELKIAGGEEGQERIDPAPPGADGQREIFAERSVEKKRSIEKIHLHETVWRVAASVATLEIDDAAEAPPKLGAVGARRKTERLNHFA